MPRRGENIYKRKDGRWEGRYIVDRRPDGRAIYHSVYGTTYGEVRQKLKTQQEAHHKRQLCGCTMTVKELFVNWQEENGQVKPTTRERYRILIEKHIQPELGAYRVCDLTEELLKLFVEKKLKSGRKRRVITQNRQRYLCSGQIGTETGETEIPLPWGRGDLQPCGKAKAN